MGAVDQAKELKRTQEIESNLKFLATRRFSQERTWFEIQSFIDGYHYQIFRDLKNSNVIDLKPVKFKSGQVRRVINLFRKVYRDMKSMIAVANYNWAIMGGQGGEEKYLHWFFKKYNVSQILSQVAGMGFKRGAGFVEVYWDGKKVCIHALETFNVYEDNQGKYFIKISKKRRKEIEESKDSEGQSFYKKDIDWTKLQEDEKAGYSDLYNFLDKRAHPSDKAQEDSLKEYKIIEFIEPNEDIGAKITYICGDQILREDTLETYKIIKYKPETEESEPLMEPLMHPAKALNRSINHIEEYIRRMAIGTYLKKKGEKTNEIKAEHGHFIEYTNRAPEQMAMQPLPASVFQYLDLMVGFHSTLSGMRIQEISGNLSGKALAYMEALSQQNAVEPMDNLKAFLSEVGRTILKIIQDKMAVSQTIYDNKKEVKVVGAVAGQDMGEGYSKIAVPDQIDVEIIPGGALSRLTQIEMAKEDFQMGAIDLQSYLEIRKIGNYGEIIERVQKEKIMAAQTGTPFRVGAGQSGGTGTGPPEATPAPEQAGKQMVTDQKELPKEIAQRKQTM